MAKRQWRSQLGMVPKLTGRPVETITDWDAPRERVWAARAEEIAEVLRRDSERHRGDRLPK